jgi:hypothetical protein
MKTGFGFKRILILPLVFLFIISTIPLVTSCVPELTFGDLLFCESIGSVTGEPIDAKDEFEVDAEKLYAVIKVSGVKGEDNYRFALKNKDTGETIQDITEQYSRKDKGFLEMYVYLESEDLEEGQIILEPGEYTVEFYHNGELIEDAEFEINKPEAKILEVTLASEIDEEYGPANPTDVFGPTDTFYACVKLDYHVAGDSLAAKWYFGENDLIDDISLDLEEYYLPGYTTFEMPGDAAYPWPAGEYKVEIYFNGELYGTYDFEVEGGETAEGTADVTFYMGNVYTSESFGFSIKYPDNWVYVESEEAGAVVSVLFTPDKDLPVMFEVLMIEEGFFDPNMLSEQADVIVTELVKEITSGSDSDQTKVSEDSGVLFGYPYEEYIYRFTDADGIEYQLDNTMILKDKDLFMFIGVSTVDYSDTAVNIYIESLSSVSFF